MNALKKLSQKERGYKHQLVKGVELAEYLFWTPFWNKGDHAALSQQKDQRWKVRWDHLKSRYNTATRPWPYKHSLKAKDFTKVSRNRPKINFSYCIWISHRMLQFCNLLNSIPILQKLDQALEIINTWKVSNSVLPSPSSLLSLPFFQASSLLDSCPGILTQKGSRQRGTLVVPNTCLRGYSKKTSVLFLLCPTAPIH